VANALRVTAPGIILDAQWVPPKSTINEILDLNKWSTDLPFVVTINDQPVLRREWDTRIIEANDNVIMLELPAGGDNNNKSVIGLVAMIAVAAIAPMLGGAAASGLGLTAGTTAFKIAAAVVGGAFAAGAGYLLSTFLAPKAPEVESGKSVYTLNASGNTARLLETIPCQYGRLKVSPDYAANPWSEYAGNDQFLNLLFSQGVGKYDIETIYVDDTVLWTKAGGVSDQFEGVDIQICDPGEEVTLFPTNVQTSAEVTGQELPEDQGWIGGFIANDAGTEAKYLALDFAFPGGIYRAESDGDKVARTVPIRAQFRRVNDAGAPLSDWEDLYVNAEARRSIDPIRWSVKIEMFLAARYEVRVRREVAHVDEGVDRLMWVGLRAFVIGDNIYNDITTVAVRMKASEQLSDYSSKRFFFVQTRIINVWDNTEGDFVEQPTRSIAWALYDAATNTRYGAGYPPERIDFDKLVDLDETWAARGDKFDHVFTSATTIWDALTLILRVGRTRPIIVGDKISFVRDEPRSVYRSSFSDREILRGTFSQDFVLQTEDAPDYVVVQYMDEDTWTMSEVECKLPGATTSRPARVQLPGIVQRDQAFREGMYYAAVNTFRREFVSFDTELDGRILRVGDLVKVTSNLPQTWGQSEEIVAVGGAGGNEVFTEHPLDWSEAGTKYALFQTRTHEVFGPIVCVKGTSDDIVYLDPDDLAAVEDAQGMTLAQAIFRRDDEVTARVWLGTAETLGRDCLVVSGEPNGVTTRLALVIDAPEVYEVDGEDVPAAPPTPVLNTPQAPIVTGLNAIVEVNSAEPILRANWNAAPGATRYVGQVSYDGMVTWVTIYDGPQTTLNAAVAPNDSLHFRVRAFGLVTGPWVTVALDTPEIIIGEGGTPNYGNVDNALRDLFNRMNVLSNQTRNLIEQLSGDTASEAAAGYLQSQKVRTQIRVQASRMAAALSQLMIVALSENDSIAGILEQVQTSFTAEDGLQVLQFAQAQRNLITRIVNNELAFAEFEENLGVTMGNLLASGLIRMTAITDGLPAGTAARIAFEVRAGTEDDFALSGLYLDALGTGESRIWCRADKFVLGNETDDAATTGFVYEDGILKLDVANIGLVRSGRILSENEKLDFDLNLPRILMFD
jgi:sulfur carrier protein ThiS